MKIPTKPSKDPRRMIDGRLTMPASARHGRAVTYKMGCRCAGCEEAHMAVGSGRRHARLARR